jgi:type IV pilus assembly protein PilQ
LATDVVAVRYADAGEMKLAVERTLTKRGHVEVDARTNQLVITDIHDQLQKALALVHQLDTSTQQIEIVAKLVDMDTGTARELGARWRLLRPGKGLVRNGTSLPTEQPYDDDLKGGGDNPISGLPRTGDFTVRAVGHTLTLDAQIHALETERKATLLSNPRVVTVNNREARILVGQRIPLIVSDVSGNPITQLQTIGIQLKVTPHITEGGTITLDVHPEVSDLSTQATVQGGVIINTSEADTRVVVENGESAMIGGMIRQVESTQSEGVPILSKIPLFGALFRYTNKTKQNRELVIFLTPRIVPPGQG